MRVSITIFILFFLNSLFAQLNWEHTAGPRGTASTNLFCGDDYAFISDNLFLYRSANAENWEKLPYPGLKYMSIHHSSILALFLDPLNLSLGEKYLRISHDNGNFWNEISKPTAEVDYSTMNVLSHGMYIVDQTHTKLLVTTNEGQSWEEHAIPLPSIYQINTDKDQIYLNDQTNLWKSDSTGSNWKEIIFPNTVSIFQVIAKDSLLIVFVTDGVYASKDSGNTFKFVAIDWYSYFQTLPVFELHSDGLLYMNYESNGFARSRDYFEKERIDLNATKRQPIIKLMRSFQGKLLVQTDGTGIHYWNENQFTLTETNNGLATPAIWHTSNTPNYFWAATSNSVYGYNLKSNLWNIDTKLPIPFKNFNFVTGNSNGQVASFSDSAYGHYYFSNDEGLHWDLINVGINNSHKQVKWITFSDQITFVHLIDSVWRSDDSGKSWQGLPFRLLNQIVKYKDQYIAADSNTFYVSKDLGSHWDTLISLPGKLIDGLESAGDYLFATIDPDGRKSMEYYSLYKSVNGIDWIKADKGLPVSYVKMKFTSRRQSDKLFFNYNNQYFLNLIPNGLFMSEDSSFNWIKVDDGSPYQFSNYHIADHFVFGSTYEKGIFKADLNTLITKTDEKISANKKDDILIYPNPFLNAIYIESIQDELKQIFIFDSDGKKVSQQYCHSNSVNIDLQTLHPGLYFLQLAGKSKQYSFSLMKN